MARSQGLTAEPKDTVCPKCREGKLTITYSENCGPEMQMELTCPSCKGVGYITASKAERIAADDALWCRCGNPSGQVNHIWSGTDIYLCRDCGGVVQTG